MADETETSPAPDPVESTDAPVTPTPEAPADAPAEPAPDAPEEVPAPAYDGTERPATTDAARPENLGPGEAIHDFAPVSESTSTPAYGQPDVGAYVAPIEDNPTGDTPVSDTPNEDAAAKFGPDGNPATVQSDLGPGEAAVNTFPGHQFPRPLHGGTAGPVGTPI